MVSTNNDIAMVANQSDWLWINVNLPNRYESSWLVDIKLFEMYPNYQLISAVLNYRAKISWVFDESWCNDNLAVTQFTPDISQIQNCFIITRKTQIQTTTVITGWGDAIAFLGLWFARLEVITEASPRARDTICVSPPCWVPQPLIAGVPKLAKAAISPGAAKGCSWRDRSAAELRLPMARWRWHPRSTLSMLNLSHSKTRRFHECQGLNSNWSLISFIQSIPFLTLPLCWFQLTIGEEPMLESTC